MPRRRQPTIRALIIASVLAVAMAPTTQATHQTNSLWRNYYYSGHNDTVWYCFDSAFPGGNYQYRVNDARTAWNNVRSELYYIWNSYPTCGELVIYWRDLTWPYADNTLGVGIVIACVTPPDRHCSATITLDSLMPWYTGLGTPSSSQYDIRSVASHEWGHVNSIRHETNDNTYVMYPTISTAMVRYVPKCHESDTVRTMYGSDGTPTCR